MRTNAYAAQGWLGRIYRLAANDGRSLLEQLERENDTRFEAIASGQALLSSSANGHAITLGSPGPGWTPLAIAELCGSLLSLHSRAQAALIAAGTTSPTDAEIYAEMIDRLGPVYSYQTDYSALRNDSQ